MRDIDGANAYIAKQYLPDFNWRFSRTPGDFPSAFVPSQGIDIDRYLAEKHERTVTNDHVVHSKQAGLVAKILPDEFRASYARSKRSSPQTRRPLPLDLFPGKEAQIRADSRLTRCRISI